jgi:enediyne biosynthesis protein E4
LGKPGNVISARLQIIWPSGHKDAITGVKPNQFVTIQEGKGILISVPINFAGPVASPR